LLYLAGMKGRKPLYTFDHLQVGDQMEVEGNLAKFAYQTTYNYNRKSSGIKLKAYKEADKTFIKRTE
jgi:hypothetical protein